MGELLFNPKAAATLASLGDGGRFPHALLIEGARGLGKKTAALAVAKRLMCVGETPPCGSCPHCHKLDKNVHPDLRFYTVPDGKREFPIELVRELRSDAYIAPNEAKCKVYVLDHAHAMNVSAQNALLKLIEEPPANTYFLLLCENRSLMLSTVLSRVTSVELERPSVEQCEKALVELAPKAGAEERATAAANAGGNIGMALELLGTSKPAKAAADARLLREALVFGERYEGLRLLAGYDKDRESLMAMLSLLREGFARLAVDGQGGDPHYRNRFMPMQAIGAADAVERAANRAARNVSIPLLCGCLVEDVKTALA